jgi:hypothetical protein
VHYFKNIIDENNFDFIYHEHMSYYSITTFIKICEINELYLENIEFINTHGGSIRAFITHKHTNNDVYYNSYLNKYLIEENNYQSQIHLLFTTLSENFYPNVKKEIQKVRYSGKRVVCYGASGRTNMIINYISEKFDIILDDSPNKINSFMPYYHNKIINSNDIYQMNEIEVIFILAWPYSKNIIKKHIQFLKNGGIFIKILPKIEYITIDNYLSFIRAT